MTREELFKILQQLSNYVHTGHSVGAAIDFVIKDFNTKEK